MQKKLILIFSLITVILIGLIVALIFHIYNKKNIINKKNELEISVEKLNKKYTDLNTLYNNKSNIVNTKLDNLPIYYINLDDSKIRNDFIKNQIKFYQISKIHRISGIDGSKINNVTKETILSKDDPISFTNNFFPLFFSKSELGCTLSHIKAIIKSYKNGDEMSIIMEDDVSFGLIPFWKDTIKEIIYKAPKDWTVISLHNQNCRNDSKDFIPITEKECWLCSMYIINKKGMLNILNHIKNNVIILDNQTSKNLASDYLIYFWAGKTYQYNKSLIFTNNNIDGMNSTIHPSHTHSHILNSINSIKQYLEPLYTGYDNYRLGDMFLHQDKHGGKAYHLSHYPNSIASKYLKKTNEKANYNILLKIINDIKISDFPDSNTIVIHLRVGDSFENGFNGWKVKPKVEDFLRKNIHNDLGSNYVKPLSYFKKLLKKVNNNINKVVIVAGSHKLLPNYDKSYQYISAIENFIKEKTKLHLILRLGKNPDEDVVYMSKSKYFIPSGGGFSKVIKKIVKLNGGKVLE